MHMPHQAGEHEPRVDAPTVTPVPIAQSPQLTSVPNNDDGVVATSRCRIIRKPSYFFLKILSINVYGIVYSPTHAGAPTASQPGCTGQYS